MFKTPLLVLCWLPVALVSAAELPKSVLEREREIIELSRKKLVESYDAYSSLIEYFATLPSEVDEIYTIVDFETAWISVEGISKRIDDSQTETKVAASFRKANIFELRRKGAFIESFAGDDLVGGYEFLAILRFYPRAPLPADTCTEKSAAIPRDCIAHLHKEWYMKYQWLARTKE